MFSAQEFGICCLEGRPRAAKDSALAAGTLPNPASSSLEENEASCRFVFCIYHINFSDGIAGRTTFSMTTTSLGFETA